jgi:hypothetical protein
LTSYPSATLVVNRIPPGYKKIESKNITEDLYFDTTRSRVVTKPRIGAFEIIIGQTLIFSKLECQRWPHIPSVLNAIKKHFEENKVTGAQETLLKNANGKSPDKSLKIKGSYSSSRPGSRSKQSVSTAFSIKDYSTIDNNYNFMGIIPENGYPSAKVNRTYDNRDVRAHSGESRISSLFFKHKMFTNNIPKSPLKRTHQEIAKDMLNLGKRSKMLLQQIPNAHFSGGLDPFLTFDFSTNRSLSRGLKSHIKPLPRPLTTTLDDRSLSRIKGRSNTVDNRRQILVLSSTMDHKRRSVEEYNGETPPNINLLDEDTEKILKENLLKTLTAKNNPTPRVEKTSKRYDSEKDPELETTEEKNPEIEAVEKMAMHLLRPNFDADPKEGSRVKSTKNDKSRDASKIQKDAQDTENKSALFDANVENLLERLEQAENEYKTARRSDNPAYEERQYTHPNSCTENTPKNKSEEKLVKEFNPHESGVNEGHHNSMENRKNSKPMLLENA